MLEFSQYSLIASVIVTSLALVVQLAVLVFQRRSRQAAPARPARQLSTVGARPAATGTVPTIDTVPITDTVDTAETAEADPGAPAGLVRYATYLAWLSLAFLTASLVFRTVATGHGPFSNQYEFAVAFGWGIMAAYVYFEYRYRLRMLSLVILPITAALLLYAIGTPGSDTVELVPALQNNLLLSVHVGAATLAYGAFAVACAAGVLYLIQSYLPQVNGRRGWPRPAVLDEISYRAVVLAFPLHTIMIILGAVWADVAWGSYWSWDPKETASLVTWLIYGAYLHARVVRGWRGRKAAWLLMLGFGAVVFTFFGNLFFGGLHSYAGTGSN
jgi:cytochrome c-type biogenesis protein CcsB